MPAGAARRERRDDDVRRREPLPAERRRRTLKQMNLRASPLSPARTDDEDPARDDRPVGALGVMLLYGMPIVYATPGVRHLRQRRRRVEGSLAANLRAASAPDGHQSGASSFAVCSPHGESEAKLPRPPASKGREGRTRWGDISSTATAWPTSSATGGSRAPATQAVPVARRGESVASVDAKTSQGRRRGRRQRSTKKGDKEVSRALRQRSRPPPIVKQTPSRFSALFSLDDLTAKLPQGQRLTGFVFRIAATRS